MNPRPDPDQLLEALDPEQREVATALSGPVAVIAGAGTGKTRAITHRIAYGVVSGVYRPTSVLAVTFTQRAAGEMRGRLQQLGVGGVQARTFHSAALRQAQYFWPKVYGGELPQVLDNRMKLVAESAHRLRLEVDTGRLRDLVGEIAWAKVSNVTADTYPEIAGSQGRGLASFDPDTVARVFAGYEEAKRERNRIDFEDILLCTAALIAENRQVADEVRRTYRHLVVDEYQDVSPLQEALLNLWRGDGSELCVVGDPAQTIHSFAGAQSSFLTGFARRHPGARVIRLVRDYRSTPQVVGVANRVIRGAVTSSEAVAGLGGLDGPGALEGVRLEAQQPPGPEVAFAEAGDEAAEARAVADWLAGRAEEGVDYREMAVLFRINAQSPAFEQALAERKIPYLVRGGERFYQRPEVRQALLTLRTESRTGSDSTAADGGGVLDRARAVFSGLGWTSEPPTGGGALRERWESQAALLSVVEEMAARTGSAAADLSAVSAELDRRAETQHVPSADGVTVSTLHSAKGLEWDAVALVGAHEGTLPFVLATRPEEIEEERRLLYVGVTRARRHLRVSWSRTRAGGGTARNASRFLAGVRPDRAAKSPTTLSATRRRPSVLSALCRSCAQPLGSAAERKLGRHTDCPGTYDERTMELLKEWRRQEAAEQSLPAYCIFTDATLTAIAESRPSTAGDLIKVHGLGRAKAERYGDSVLAIIASTPAGQAPERR